MSTTKTDQIEDTVEIVSEDGNAASNMATIASKPTSVSRSDLIAKMVDYATKCDKGELADLISRIGTAEMNPNSTTPDERYASVKAAANAVGDNSAKNMATIKSSGKHADPMPSVKEDLDLLFGGSDDLSEDFRLKVSTLFEAAVSTRVNIEVAKIEEDIETRHSELAEQYEKTLAESIEEIKNEMVENIDTYLNYAVAEWITENKLAVQNNIRTQIAESFISSLKNVFEDHYVNIPDDQVDVVEAMANELEEIKARLEETASENAKLSKIVNEKEVNDITSTVAEGMTDTQKEKFVKLTEAINYSDINEFRKKVSIIKETYFPKNTEVKVAKDQLLSETVEEPVKETSTGHDPVMQMYVSSLSKLKK
jgi:adenylate kinase family enzyme